MSYQIIKGTTLGEPHCESELVGYDWDTGEEIYENVYHRGWDPHEDIISEYSVYEEAVSEYDKQVEDFSNQHHWPWNNYRCEFAGNAICTCTFTNNEDSVWFALKEIE